MNFFYVGFVECENCRRNDEILNGTDPSTCDDGLFIAMKRLNKEALANGYKYMKFTNTEDGRDDDGWVCPECQSEFERIAHEGN